MASIFQPWFPPFICDAKDEIDSRVREFRRLGKAKTKTLQCVNIIYQTKTHWQFYYEVLYSA